MLGIIGTVNGLTRPGPCLQHVGLGLHGEQAAHAGADTDSDAIGVGFCDCEASVGEGLFGGDDTEFAEPIPALGLLGFKEACGIEVLHLGGKTTGVLFSVEQSDRRHAIAA